MHTRIQHTLSRRGMLKHGLLGALAFSGVGRLQASGKPAFLGLPVPVEASPYKTYLEAKQVELPRDFSFRGLSLEEAIQQRRSVRRYADKAISLLELSQLLHYASGITSPRMGFRAAPSAGATYPIELYPVVNNVTRLAPGVYHYAVKEHKLELVAEGDFSRQLTRACRGQAFVGRCAAAVAMTAVYGRTDRRYGKRAKQYVHMEIGYIGENLYLAARSLGMGACAVGAFDDNQLAKLLGIDGRTEVPLLVTTIGKLAR